MNLLNDLKTFLQRRETRIKYFHKQKKNENKQTNTQTDTKSILNFRLNSQTQQQTIITTTTRTTTRKIQQLKVNYFAVKVPIILDTLMIAIIVIEFLKIL